MWNVDGVWLCKSGQEEKKQCPSNPVELHTDMEDVIAAIK